MEGWSEADKKDGPLFNAHMRDLFIRVLKQKLREVDIIQSHFHINDPPFARVIVEALEQLM